MQIQSGQRADNRSSDLLAALDSRPSHPVALPGLRSGQQAVSLIPTDFVANSSSSSTATQPDLREAHELEPALQDAFRQDNWSAVIAAQSGSSGARLDDIALMRHAAQAGANRIVFRLQSKSVSPFASDIRSSAFYIAMKHGQKHVAETMLNNHSVIEQRGFPDLKPFLEAAVDDSDGKAIAWLVAFSLKNKSGMPFEFLREAIHLPNARWVELLINHPAFASVLNDPAAERLFLVDVIENGTSPMLGLLLARRRCRADTSILCDKSGPEGNTLLHLAAAVGDHAKLKLILDFDPLIRREGASDSFFTRLMQGDTINLRNNSGKTALTIALDAGHAGLASMFRARGALG